MATLPDVRRQPPCARPAASACSRAAPHRLRPGRRRCALPPQALPQWDGERAERELVGGEPALLSVGTRWCGPCAALAPALLKAAGALEDTRVQGKVCRRRRRPFLSPPQRARAGASQPPAPSPALSDLPCCSRQAGRRRLPRARNAAGRAGLRTCGAGDATRERTLAAHSVRLTSHARSPSPAPGSSHPPTQTTLVFRDGAELWRCEGLTDARELVRRACAALTGEEAEVFLMENEQWR